MPSSSVIFWTPPPSDPSAAAANNVPMSALSFRSQDTQIVHPAAPLAEPTPPPPDITDLRIPGYILEETIGRGGMGVVYRARQLVSNRPVALKMLNTAHAKPEDRLRFEIEAQAIAQLKHPNIVELYHVGDTDGHEWLSLELVEGGTLAMRLIAGPIPPRESAALLEPIARAVDFAHQQRIIHRDLKPANILIAKDGTPKITDFGLAKFLDQVGHQLTIPGMVAGTPVYMAPEQIHSPLLLPTPAVDIYSLGVILYEMLVGRPPFLASTPLELMNRIVYQPPLALRLIDPSIPADLEAICLTCLAKNPQHRYPTAAALADDLARFLQGRSIRVLRRPWLHRLGASMKRNPAITALLAGSLLLLLVHDTLERQWLPQLSSRHETLSQVAGVAALPDPAAQASLVEQQLREDLAEQRRATQTQQTLRQQAEQRSDDLTKALYAARCQLTQSACVEGQFALAEQRFRELPAEPTAFEWRYLRHAIQNRNRSTTGIRLDNPYRQGVALRFSTDSGRLLGYCADGSIIWDFTKQPNTIETAGPSYLAWAMDKVEALPWLLATHRQFLLQTAPMEAPTLYRPTGQRLLALEMPSSVSLTRAVFSADGQRLFAGTDDGSILIWDTASGRIVLRLPFASQAVYSLALSSNGRILAASTSEGKVHLWLAP